MNEQQRGDCTVHRFSVSVNCRTADAQSSTDSVQDGECLYEDYGFLMLPRNYDSAGAATRLIISCHGAGGTVETDDSQIEQQVLTKYLVVNGYAVMDVNGLPMKFAAEKGIDIRNNIGSPLALQSYVKAYHLVTERFNLKPEVFVMGGSMGGISSTNLVLSGCIPVVAQAGFCPVLDAYRQIFLHPWSDGLPKTALGILYGLERDASGRLVYDESRLCGCNPMARCVPTPRGEMLAYPVPVKFWQCEDDNTVSIEPTKRFVSAIRNAGGIASLRTFPYGEHEPQDVGVPLSAPSGIHVFNGEQLAVRPAVEEVFLWFRRFS